MGSCVFLGLMSRNLKIDLRPWTPNSNGFEKKMQD